ncbi:hypothetical protein [Tahibacter soli]|uniref:Lipoprotein n=1 Tax=Tahibacter soli TaxID=2983605 RepID=A0A9X3YJT3_9GAMM|nr:hypothetical protein [Tahibacter soli]MDC8012505.1 hypothetical protein [Tahibacter soli]
MRVATSVLALILAACGGADRVAASDIGAACARDAQCASGFCDRDRCAAPTGDYGRRCTPAPRGADGLRDGKLNVCGAYVCALERCRSCASGDQCLAEYGAPACVASGDRPGARCGR